ncbi:MAG TPA: hypothetical protein PKC78_14690 [Accumulibacter sp.]|nr:hypothetical protein [Accumulibacter sp.]
MQGRMVAQLRLGAFGVGLSSRRAECGVALPGERHHAHTAAHHGAVVEAGRLALGGAGHRAAEGKLVDRAIGFGREPAGSQRDENTDRKRRAAIARLRRSQVEPLEVCWRGAGKKVLIAHGQILSSMDGATPGDRSRRSGREQPRCLPQGRAAIRATLPSGGWPDQSLGRVRPSRGKGKMAQTRSAPAFYMVMLIPLWRRRAI